MAKSILVVEDNELNLKLFRELLQAHGHATEGLRDGREVIDHVRRNRPDLIIMDIQLPHISGLDIIRMLKADTDLKSIPVLAVTAFAGAGDHERIRDEGAEDCISKPITVARFIETVQRLIG